MQIPDNALSTLMFLAGAGLLTLILLKRWHRYFRGQKRRQKNEPVIDHQPRPTDAWTGTHRDTAAHIERQKVELQDMARDVAGQLNSKMMVLQRLIAQSNEQISRMEELVDQLEKEQA